MPEFANNIPADEGDRVTRDNVSPHPHVAAAVVTVGNGSGRNDTAWCLIDDFGDGEPSVGPFATCEEAEAYDPTDDTLGPAVEMDRAEYERISAAIRARVTRKRRAAGIDVADV